MTEKQLEVFQRSTINRMYGYIDELDSAVGNTDLPSLKRQLSAVRRAIDVELEGIEEAAKEHLGL